LKKYFLFLAFVMLTFSQKLHATHIFAGDLLYTHISGNTYKISLVLYGDCGASSNLISELYVGNPQIYINNGAFAYTSVYLSAEAGTGEEVSPVCPAQKDSTSCQYGTLPGIRRFTFSDTITLPYTSGDWNFVFNGFISNNSSAGRSNNISNVQNVGNQTMYLVATLNNLDGPNSSPIYTTIPTPYYCVNVSQQYNQGATDPDADVLRFEMTPALIQGVPVSYIWPYTALHPISSPDFSFSTLNGQMSFTPDITQNSLVANKVSEYKNGVLVGSSMREMTFIVIPCDNIPPDGDLATNGSNITGGIHEGNNIINVCKKYSSELSFTIDPDDSNQHDIKVTVFNAPAGANINVINDSSVHPVINFNWNLASVPSGVYTFYVNYKDDGCPLVSSKTIAYTIRISDPYSLLATVLEETECQHLAYVRLDVTDGLSPQKLVLRKGGDIVRVYNDSSGVIYDSLAAGSYIATISNPLFPCDTTVSFTINDSGQYPVLPGISDSLLYCRYDVAAILNPELVPGAVINWYDENGVPSNSPVVNTDQPGAHTWYATQTVNVCESERQKITLIVRDLPEVQLQMKTGEICYAEKIYLAATGASHYYWEPTYEIQKEKDGRMYIRVMDSSAITVTGTDDNGCKDTASINYQQIEQCCRFTYPNAFTPNNDGKNDRFRPILYGEMEEYDLRIFNRFGEVVFRTTDPATGWDGNYKSEACDVGMYYFMVRAKCYTGTSEFYSNAVELLR
jgi:gliding motility-associated-like protein